MHYPLSSKILHLTMLP